MAASITVQKSDDATVTLNLANADGSAYVATGQTLELTVQRNALGAPLITKTVTSFTNGGSRAAIIFSQSDLNLDVRAYFYELILIDQASNRRTSGLNPFVVTQNNSGPQTVSVQVGSTVTNLAVTISDDAPIDQATEDMMVALAVAL